MNLTQVQSVQQLLSEPQKIVIVPHKNPDGDAISSLGAIGLALETKGKTVIYFNPDPIPAVYRFLPSASRIISEVPKEDDFDTAVILDCGDLDRIGSAADIVRQIPVVINIDHHVTNTGFGTVQLVDSSACATAELVYPISQMTRRMSREVEKSLKRKRRK